MKNVFREYLESYPALMRSAMEENEKKDIIKAKEYIEKHYRDPRITELR